MGFFEVLENRHCIKLNEQQRNAVTHVNGPALVLAGPGSGKTTVVTSRTAYLVLKEGVSPSNILTMTFNRAAKYEMENRFKRIFGSDIGSKVNFSTFHSFCNLVVRDYENRQGKRLKRIEGSEEDINKRFIIKKIYQEINGIGINDDQLEDLINEMGLVKNKMVKDLAGMSFNTKNFASIYKAYEDYKRSNLFMDFDDMLSYAYSILIKCPDILSHYKEKYRFFQVDEGQDLSKIQFEILRLLVRSKENNLFIVADDDQSIYGFRGAEPQYILDIEKQFSGCRLYYLENNYRSTGNIVEISSSFIKKNSERYDKNHRTENQYKYDPFIVQARDETEQLKFIIEKVKEHSLDKSGKKLAVLYRNSLSSVPIADALDRSGINFNIKQNKLFFFSHWVVQDILSFLKFSLNQCDVDSFMRIYYKMSRYISKSMLEQALSIGYEDSIIDGILRGSEIKPFQRKSLEETRMDFKRLAKAHPVLALEYIEENFRYFDSVRDYCESTGIFFDSLYSLFGILKTIATGLKTVPMFLQRMDELKELLDREGQQHKSNVTLTTVHSSKGLEYDCVIMIDLVDSEFPGRQAIDMAKKNANNSMLEEERRLFYVGMTRAKEYLYLVYPKVRNDSFESRSMFITEVLGSIKSKASDSICEGMIVNHKYFGEGVIVTVLEQSNDRTILEIDFKGIRRKLDLSTCIESGLLILG
ncbi:MAG: ATP-dependent helicase [Bacillota bacterium]